MPYSRSPIMDRYEQFVRGDVGHSAGSFPTEVLREIEALLPQNMKYSAETGCGKSTILFSNTSERHVVFALDDRYDENSSVTYYENCPVTNLSSIETVFGSTQLTLPYYKHSLKYDAVLIDGPHGWPFPELEYYYFYPHIATGGLLIVDDLCIPTIGRMADILAEDKMWDLVNVAGGNTGIFRRTSEDCFDPYADGWFEQVYNRRRVSTKREIFIKLDEVKDAISSANLDIANHGGI